MRALVAILILVIGAGLGYGWHEVSPRMLGSAPFCGPKYPGMLRAIPEDEYFPRRLFADGRPFVLESLASGPDGSKLYSVHPWLERILIELEEPSLWRLAQQGNSAVRFYYAGINFALIITIRETGDGASIRSIALNTDYDTNFEVVESAEYEISAEQLEQVNVLLAGGYGNRLPISVWNECRYRIRPPNVGLTEDWGGSFIVDHGGNSFTLEIAEPGRYIMIGEYNADWGTWMWETGSSLTRVSGLPTYVSYFDDWIAEVQAAD